MARNLVLLHGFTHTGASWDPVVTALGERYLALAPDIRGHGASSSLEPVTLDSVLEDLARLLPSRFTLAGYSMGGRIALHAALALPARVQRLVLIGASPGLADPGERAARAAADEALARDIEGLSIEDFARRWAATPVLAGQSPEVLEAAHADRLRSRPDGLARDIESLSIEDFARRWAATPVLAGQSPEVLEAAHADRLRSRPDGLARGLRGLGTATLPPVRDRLRELAMPVTLIAGERDDKFRALAEWMADLIPRAQVEVVAGAGHAVHLETPERVAEIIAASDRDPAG
jgi:2-succinyl-6-hydroxy-2,4-cyclohexadiene-1-carboxylate synthase